ncbi:MAG: sensor histidine kinase [Clostridiales bacterium]|nr:sensor histidine kinase [Clostridiales bacterium]
MKEERRMRSIAKRMNRTWFFRIFWIMVLIDLFVVGLALAGWCYAAEEMAGGFQWADIPRNLSWEKSVKLMDRLETITYTFESIEGQQIQVSARAYFQLVKPFMKALLGFEAVVLIIQYGAGKKKSRRLLVPLERMAQTAQELSQQQFDVERLHHLEDAIATVSPLSPESKLKTGDKELQGLEQAVNDLVTRMHEAYREQSRFVSDASHELRTPIAVIQGYADMLSRWGKDDEKVLEEGISAIQSESAHMKKLIEQLLFLARGDNGRNQLVYTQVDLAGMMREVYEESCMIHEDRKWQLSAEGKVTVNGDGDMLKQTARILVDNAVKYTVSGDKITLRAYVKDGIPCFEVQDNGIGIKEEDINHIFERFFRSDPARSRSTGGTGLGLSIAKWIVEKHQGYFEVFSREEIGTRITVLLPQDEKEKGGARKA